MKAARLWADQARLPDGWARGVLLEVGADGRWAQIGTGVLAAPDGATVLAGPVLPGMVNAHSHAFQRAFVALAETREQEADDFWSWRDRMYRVALRVEPGHLRAIAAHLYAELLAGGYTQVCEFHYLHHDLDGRAYRPDPWRMAWALADAAADAGIGLTLLPAVYERAGFAQPQLRNDQRRFRLGPDDAWAFAHAVRALGRPLLSCGLAIHSLRAAGPDAIKRLQRHAEGFSGPIHVHVAEQTAEIADCLAHTGCRPVEWLAQERLLDSRWNLIHATHTLASEIDAVASSGSTVVLCPTTEGNLGDGLADVPAWLRAGVPIAVGSDSHVTRDWREELRWVEYSQRLVLRKRNVGALPGQQASTGARWWELVNRSGAASCGEALWGLRVGARADLLVADSDDAALQGVPLSSWLDAQIFSSPVKPWRSVMVGGRWVVHDGRHHDEQRIARDYRSVLAQLAVDLPARSGQ